MDAFAVSLMVCMAGCWQWTCRWVRFPGLLAGQWGHFWRRGSFESKSSDVLVGWMRVNQSFAKVELQCRALVCDWAL